MTSFQSTLGEGVAEELAESQREISIAEFFEKNKHMLGFDSEARGVVTAVKEGVDNSLTHSTPFVYRADGETIHRPIGEAIDELIAANREAVMTRRGGDLEQLRVDGVEALSFDADHRVDFRRVSSVFRHRVNSDIYRLTVEGGRTVELTDYHSVFVLRDGTVQSVQTCDITEDDFVVLPEGTWSGSDLERVDLVSELTRLPPERTENVGLHGVGHLLERYDEEIREWVDESYRLGDFRQCDRLPLELVRYLDLSPTEYEDCEIGVRYGRHTVPAVLPVDAALAELLGLYVAEGCVTGSEGDLEKIYLSLGAHETRLRERAEELVRSVFDIEPSTTPAHETAVNVTISSQAAALVLSAVFEPGHAAAEKRLPRHVLDFPAPLRERFLLGYAAGDGHPTEAVVDVLCDGGSIVDVTADRLTLSTASGRLSSGLRYLLSSVGLDATHQDEPPETRRLDGRPASFGASHTLYVRTDQSAVSRGRLPAEAALAEVTDPKLAYNLDGRQDRVVTDHALALADGGDVEFAGEARRLAEGDLTVLPVTDVERIDYDGEWVYDVSVPGDENFMAGTAPLACHNSLDACEEAGIRPDIYVELSDEGDYYRVVIEDNGPGITREQVPKVFGKLLYGSRFHKREQSLTPDQEVLVRHEGTVETVPIGVLVEAYLHEDAGDVAPVPDDLEVPSFDRESHEVTWQPVTEVIRHETAASTYEVSTARGRTVEVTGDHSLFTLGADGTTTEVAARELDPGDTVLAPASLPSPGDVTSVNLLDQLPRAELAERDLYVYGFDEETLMELRDGDRVRRRPDGDSDRRRTYHAVDGVEILRDSLETNYIPKGYLPAETVIDLGWTDRAAEQGCSLRTYEVGGDPTEVPVSVDLTPELARLLGYYVAEGHVDDRQAGFTFETGEATLIERTERAVTGLGGSTTTVERDRNSTRVKAFGSPLVLFLESVCGAGADEKRVPPFLFEAPADVRQAFLEAVYEGDGSAAGPANELSHTTVSEQLARGLSVLWTMDGVVASTETRPQHGDYGEDPATAYLTKVYGTDVALGERFDTESDVSTRELAYERVPTALLDEVRVDTTERVRVPDTVPGLLLGAGLGSSLEHAEVYRDLCARAVAGDRVTEPRYAHRMTELGLLDETGHATPSLERLWTIVQSLEGVMDGDLRLLEVESVTETDPPEHVYDLSVPGATGYDENFVVVNDGPLAVRNSRGQQGIGISAAVLYSQLTSGKPAKITSRTQGGGDARYFEVVIDTDTNEPEIRAESDTTWDRPHGTRIELEMEANMRARQRLHDYIEHTAVVNPHARIEMVEPEAHLKFERGTETLPAETEEIRPHPHGVELGQLISMLQETDSYSLSGFLQGEFTRVGAKTAADVIEAFVDRHVGRELSWRPPRDHEDADVRRALEEAVANKGREATAAFADRVGTVLEERDRVAHGELRDVIEEVGEAVGAEFDVTFGATVRDNAVAAAWEAVTADLESDLYLLVDEATTDRKDDATVQGLAERLAGYIADADTTRHRFTRARLGELVDDAAARVEEYEDATVGETARENVLEAVWTRTREVPDDPPKVSVVAADRDAASDLHDAMLAVDIIAPPTGCLAPITEDELEAGLRKEYDAEFFAAATRDADVHGGDPFVVEAGIAYGGALESEGDVTLMRFANRVPLVYQRGACAITDVVTGINWRNYGLDQPGGSGMPGGPAVLMVHVASTNVPFTSESKDAVANVPAIESEIELALREAARDLKSHINRREEREQRRRKRNVLAEILPTMAEKVSDLTEAEPLHIEDSLARIMNNVLVERAVEDDRVTLRVVNHGDRTAEPELTDILDHEPTDLDGGSVVEMDGEWFLSWEPSVAGGETAELTYTLAPEAESDLSVAGVEDERLTVDR